MDSDSFSATMRVFWKRSAEADDSDDSDASSSSAASDGAAGAGRGFAAGRGVALREERRLLDWDEARVEEAEVDEGGVEWAETRAEPLVRVDVAAAADW